MACDEIPSIGIGTCWFFHCTVGCVPTREMPVIMTSGFSPSILLKIGVKSVVSGENRIWSRNLEADGRQALLVAGVQRRGPGRILAHNDRGLHVEALYEQILARPRRFPGGAGGSRSDNRGRYTCCARNLCRYSP